MTDPNQPTFAITGDPSAILSRLRIDDGLQPEPWANVDRDGNVTVLDMDRARAASKAGHTCGWGSRAIAALVIEAYNQGVAAGEAKAT